MHMKRNKVSGILGGLVFSAMLAACGSGGSGDGPPAPPVASSAEGLWTGTSDEGRSVAGAILDDGSYWFLYSTIQNPTIIAGALQGTGEGRYGTFTSSNGRDFAARSEKWLDANITATYTERQQLNGIVVYTAGPAAHATSTFAGLFSPESDRSPDLAAVAGSYRDSFFPLRIASYTVTVTPTGAFSIHENIYPALEPSGCSATGTLSPRAHGNVYDLTVTLGPGGWKCGTAGTYTGVAAFDATANRLYLLAVNENRSETFTFMGTK